MKTFFGDRNIPPFKIVGSNELIQAFESECRVLGLEVSGLNSCFREDGEHCLMPCYAYDENQPDNIKLQTLSVDVYTSGITYRLPEDHDLALAMTEVINSVQGKQ